MPFVKATGVRIHYRVEGDPGAPPLLLHHGWWSDMESWRDFGYVNALTQRYRVILLDARGHGGSESPGDAEAYAPARFAEDVEAVLDAAEASRVTFWGYSMGGAAGFQLAAQSPARISRLIVGGMHPYGRSEGTGSGSAALVRLLREEGMAGFVAERERGLGGRLVEPLRGRLLAADALGQARAGEAWAAWEGIGPVLDELTMPAVMYAGTGDRAFHDGAMRAASAMPCATFLPLPGLAHDAAFASSRTVLEALSPYLR